MGGFLGFLLGVSILTVCEILDYIWTFLFVHTGWRISGSVTWSFNPYCLWDPGFSLNLSVCSHRLEDFWVCYLELQSSLSVRYWILSEPFSIFTGWRIPGPVTWSFNPHSLWDTGFHPGGCDYSVEWKKSPPRGDPCSECGSVRVARETNPKRKQHHCNSSNTIETTTFKWLNL